MHCVLVNRFFWPDESATALLLTDLAEDLLRAGHRVTVLTSRLSTTTPALVPSKRQVWKHIEILRIRSTRFGKRNLVARLMDLLTFHLGVAFAAHDLGHPDVWFVMTDPPLLLERILAIRRRVGGRVIHHVDDLYPDVAVALGTLPHNHSVTRLIETRARRALAGADMLIALGECMAVRLMGQGLPATRIRVAPPWADGERLKPCSMKRNGFRQRFGYGRDAFLVMYSGNMGMGHPFGTILNSAHSLRHSADIHFAFIGDGVRRSAIESFRCEHNLSNLRLFPYQPRTLLQESLSAADVHLISLDPRVQGIIVPSKLAGILAVGKPVIFLGESSNSVAQAILKSGCGFVVPDGDVQGLVKALTLLKNNRGLVQAMSQKALACFKQEYDRKVVVSKIISWMENPEAD